MSENIIQETIKLFEKQVHKNVKGVYVSSTLYENLKEANKISQYQGLSTEIFGYYEKDGSQIPVICDWIIIGNDKSNNHLLEDWGKNSFKIKE